MSISTNAHARLSNMRLYVTTSPALRARWKWARNTTRGVAASAISMAVADVVAESIRNALSRRWRL